ncbi:MAG: hypothetical protein H0T89_32090 [Deltaproteobacteria bacterium]|nr:hypothetical protein [Deltaproteobacteria bacterium]MDQ3299467.1 hypothetical protein [Myxococcota bacterium]
MGHAPDLGNQDLKSLEMRGETIYSDRDYDQITAAADRGTQIAIASGSSFELFAGVIAVAVGVAGIAGYAPIYLASTATIAVGFALLAQGGTMAARWQNAVHIAGSERTEAVGIGTEVFGGLAGIALGVLALFGVSPLTLLPVAALVLGVALLLGGPAQPQIAEVAPARSPRRWHVTRDAVRTSSGVMVMAGVAAIALGILALATDGPVLLLSLIAMVCVAAALVLAGGALAARFARRFA